MRQTAGKRVIARCERLSPRGQTALLLSVAFVLLVAAMPVPLTRGMLYAEEGTTYLRYAREATAWRALLAPHQGYYSLLPNTLALFASRCVPLHWLPLLFAWAALAVHLAVVWAAATCERFSNFRGRAVAAGVTLLAAGSARTLESTINSQYFFGVMAVLILLSDPGRRRVSRSLLLIVGSLSGLYVCFLSPVFFLRSLREKTAAAWWQTFLVVSLTAVQLATLVRALPHSTRALPQQSLSVYIGSFLTNEVVLSFGSRLLYRPLTLFLVQFGSPLLYALVALLAVLCWAALFQLVRRAGRSPLWLLALAPYVAACASMGILGGPPEVLGDGDRYHVVSNACLGLSLLLAAQKLPAGSQRQRVCRVLLALVLFSGAFDLARQWRSNQYDPAWAPQVLAWENNPSTPLTTAPLHWRGNKLLYPPQPLRMDLPYYLYDSNVRPSVRARIPPVCFEAHLASLPAGFCEPH